MSHKPKIFSDLERLASLIPAPITWLDVNGVGIGGNDLAFQSIGAAIASEQIVGKTLYEFYTKDVADILMKNIQQVIKGKKSITFEESIKDIKTGKIKWFLTTRAPLFDDDEINVIGVVCTSIEITDRKELERVSIENEQHEKFKKIVNQAANETKSPLAILLILAQQCDGLTQTQVFEKLKALASSVPITLYWVDTNSKFIGANKGTIEAIGLKTVEDSIGKTAYDFYPHEMAERIIKHNNEVMRTGKVLSQEEPIVDVSSGEKKYFMAFKAPLYDEKGNIIGLVGTSVDITTEKTAKKLVIENAGKNAIIAEHERFAKVASQFSHDIGNALTTLEFTTEKFKEDIPEEGRIALMTAKTQIEDISYALLAEHSSQNKAKYDAIEARKPMFVSLILLELLTAERYHHRNQAVVFKYEFGPNSKFAFIKAAPSAIERMITNLVNNAVDAFDGEAGEIIVRLIVDEIQAKISIQDNGKGIPKDVLEKLKNNISVTSGKKDGHGIGMMQICDAIKDNNGEINIESEVGKGTKVTLTFPIIPMPEWATNVITLHHDDTIVILDDDPSVHRVWDMRFKDYTGLVTLTHFTQGDEAIAFINADIDKFKGDIVLLSDYELLKQKRNGLEIIEAAKVPRSFLVTSHFANHKILDLIKKTHVKMLPKSLAGDVSIKFIGRTEHTNVANSEKIEE